MNDWNIKVLYRPVVSVDAAPRRAKLVTVGVNKEFAGHYRNPVDAHTPHAATLDHLVEAHETHVSRCPAARSIGSSTAIQTDCTVE